MTPARLAFGGAGRARLMGGVRLLAAAVRVSFGPGGRTVLIDRGGGAPRITRDGGRIAEEIELADRFADMGARLVRRAAARTAEEVGDGRSTATLLAAEILEGGVRALAAGIHPTALKAGLDAAAAAALAALAAASRPAAAEPDLARTAAAAAAGDREIGAMAARAVVETGPEGVVSVETGRSRGIEIELLRGMRLGAGYASPCFMTDPETTLCELERPLLLVHDGRLDRHEPLLRALEAAVRARRPLLIVAQAVAGEALATLTASKLRGGLRLAAVAAPLFGDRRQAVLEDVAAVVGAELVAEDRGLSLHRVGREALGGVRRATASRTETLLIEGEGDPCRIAERLAGARLALARAESEAERSLLRDRLACLAGRAAVLRIGGASESEIAVGIERARDAARAARAALSGGVVAGGGAALLDAARSLDPRRPAEAVLARALTAPLRQIADNAGAPGRTIAARVAADPRAGFGFDAADGAIKDMVEAGIVDATEIVRTALRNAVSVAGMILTTEAVLARPPSPRQPEKERPFGPTSPDFTAEELPGLGLAPGGSPGAGRR